MKMALPTHQNLPAHAFWYAKNFEETWHDNYERSSILSLDYETFSEILSSEKLTVKSEYIVWKAIHDWVRHDKDNRLQRLTYLIYKCLRFGRLDEHFIEIFIFECELFMELCEAERLGTKKFMSSVLQKNKQKATYTFTLSNSVKAIYFVPRKSHTTSETDPLLVCVDSKAGIVEFYDHHNTWHSSPLSLQLPNNQENFKLALLGTNDNMLYAFGGSDANFNPLSEMWSRSLNDVSSQWVPRAAMQQERVDFCSVVLDGIIYVFGGQFRGSNPQNHPFSSSSCEQYNNKLDKWSTVPSMHSARTGASAAVLNGCIYVAGGKNGNVLMGSVEKFDIQKNKWSQVAPMITARDFFTLTPFAGRLWAVGGSDADGPLSTIESYDPLCDTWREEAELKKRRWKQAAIAYNEELYVVCSKRKKGPNRHVEKYVPGKGWMNTGQLVGNITKPTLIIVNSAYKTLFTFSSD